MILFIVGRLDICGVELYSDNKILILYFCHDNKDNVVLYYLDKSIAKYANYILFYNLKISLNCYIWRIFQNLKMIICDLSRLKTVKSVGGY